MRRAVQDRNGQSLGTIGDVCAVGQVGPAAIDDSMGAHEVRPLTERSGTITITLPMLDALTVVGKRVAIFTIEE